MQTSVNSASRYKQPLGFGGQIARGRNTHFQTFATPAADSSIKIGYFAQTATQSATLSVTRNRNVAGLITNKKTVAGWVISGFDELTRPIDVSWSSNTLDSSGNPLIVFNQYTGEFYAESGIIQKNQPFVATLTDRTNGQIIGIINFNKTITNAVWTNAFEYDEAIDINEAAQGTDGMQINGELLGLVVFDNLRNGDLQNAKIKRGQNVIIMRQGSAYIETDKLCRSGDYIMIKRSNGELVFTKSRNFDADDDTYIYTGFGVLKGNANEGIKSIIEITTDCSWGRGEIDWTDGFQINAYNDGTNNIFQAYSGGQMIYKGVITTGFSLQGGGFSASLEGGNLFVTLTSGKSYFRSSITSQPTVIRAGGDALVKVECDENAETQIYTYGNAYANITLNGGTGSFLAQQLGEGSILVTENSSLDITLNGAYNNTAAKGLRVQDNGVCKCIMNGTSTFSGHTNERGNLEAYGNGYLHLIMNDESRIVKSNTNSTSYVLYCTGNANMRVTMNDSSRLRCANWNSYIVYGDSAGALINIDMNDNSWITCPNERTVGFNFCVIVRNGAKTQIEMNGNSNMNKMCPTNNTSACIGNQGGKIELTLRDSAELRNNIAVDSQTANNADITSFAGGSAAGWVGAYTRIYDKRAKQSTDNGKIGFYHGTLIEDFTVQSENVRIIG